MLLGASGSLLGTISARAADPVVTSVSDEASLVAAVSDPATEGIVLGADVAITQPLRIDHTLTLDLAGHTLTAAAIAVEAHAAVTLADGESASTTPGALLPPAAPATPTPSLPTVTPTPPWLTITGDLLLATNLNVPADTAVSIGSGGRMAVSPAATTPTDSGTAEPRLPPALTGDGSIDNGGTITLTAVDPALTISGHNYLLTFVAPGADPASGTVRVYANDLADGERAVPAAVRPGWWLNGWGEHNQSAALLTPTTPLTADATFAASWTHESLRLNAATPTAVAGATIAFAVTAYSPAGDPIGDRTTSATLTTNDPTARVTGHGIRFTTAGAHRVTATVPDDPTDTDTGTSTSTSTSTSTTTIDITADHAHPATLQLDLGATRVTSGETVVARVTGTDRWGNELADVAAAATLTSDHPGDTVTGAEVTLRRDGVHEITARLGEASDSATITVGDTASHTTPNEPDDATTAAASSDDTGANGDDDPQGAEAAAHALTASVAVPGVLILLGLGIVAVLSFGRNAIHN